MQRLKDQVAIVTGGAQGLGGAISRRLAEEGARVLLLDLIVLLHEGCGSTLRLLTRFLGLAWHGGGLLFAR